MTNNITDRKTHIIIESLNASTHGIAALLSIVGLILLILKGLDLASNTALIAYSIYGGSLIVLFLNSTLYHSFSLTRFRNFFQKLDHSAIYILIAGTYTPYLMLGIGGNLGRNFMIVVWALALFGILFELFLMDRFPKLSLFMYLGLGWIGVLIVYPLIQNIEFNGVTLLAVGGLAYTIGTIFYAMKSNKWMHIIWHLFVIAGAFFMYLSILIYV